MGMESLGGKGGKPWQGQIQTISPRTRNNYSACCAEKYRLDSRVLNAVEKYDQSMDDSGVLARLKSSGIEADLRDVHFARALL